MGAVNSCSNPVIYWVFMPAFRKAVKSLLCSFRTTKVTTLFSFLQISVYSDAALAIKIAYIRYSIISSLCNGHFAGECYAMAPFLVNLEHGQFCLRNSHHVTCIWLDRWYSLIFLSFLLQVAPLHVNSNNTNETTQSTSVKPTSSNL